MKVCTDNQFVHNNLSHLLSNSAILKYLLENLKNRVNTFSHRYAKVDACNTDMCQQIISDADTFLTCIQSRTFQLHTENIL